jgi:orotidine-5'-phosphate decarboxylase
VVCAASDLATVRQAAPGLLAVVPGIRPAGTGHHDQARTAAPGDAVRAGAGLLVVGRAVTEAAGPEEAAAGVAAEVAAARAARGGAFAV